MLGTGLLFLKSEWVDYIIDDPSWLRADTFSWHSGDSEEANSYEKVYQHLANDIDGKTLQTETVAGITIQYYLADDTHKICPASEEQNLIDLYNTTGIAWYYIIDEENIRFKLPRTKWGFTGYRGSGGGYVAESLPNIKGSVYTGNANSATSAVFKDASGVFGTLTATKDFGNKSGNSTDNYGLSFNASSSSSTYQDNAPVQQRATQMYLYFYVGEYTMSSIENTAGQNMSIVNQKADADLHNINPTGKEYVANLSMPSSTYDSVPTLASGQTYTAPANGCYRISWYPTSTGGWINVVRNADDNVINRSYGNSSAWTEKFLFEVAKGDEITISYGSAVLESIRFYYANGDV